jgi:hypothetical protein
LNDKKGVDIQHLFLYFAASLLQGTQCGATASNETRKKRLTSKLETSYSADSQQTLRGTTLGFWFRVLIFEN